MHLLIKFFRVHGFLGGVGRFWVFSFCFFWLGLVGVGLRGDEKRVKCSGCVQPFFLTSVRLNENNSRKKQHKRKNMFCRKSLP